MTEHLGYHVRIIVSIVEKFTTFATGLYTIDTGRRKGMDMRKISTDSAPAAIGPYSQGIIANGMLFASGQIALDPVSGELVGTTIEEQSEQVMKNVSALLKAADTDLDHVVKTTCFLADIGDFAVFNEVYGRYFTGNLPARSAVGVAALPKGALIEVEVIASLE